ncbi:ribonuclease H-like domain-containing protein [Tanacetum coccineum]
MSHPANDEFSQHLSNDEESNHEDASDTSAAPKQKQQVIQNGNSKKRISTGNDRVIRILPPVTAAEIQAVEKERKAKNILLTAIPKEHMRRFHGMEDAKEIWEAIRTSSEGLEKGYDRFQQLLSQLEAHGAEVSNEDANYKFLRSLPPAWSNLAITMRTKPDVDTLSIDDLYNNLRVFEQEIQGASKTSSSAQNVAFVSQSKSSTNKVKSGFTGAYSTCTPSTSSTNISEKEVLAGFADEVIYSLFAKQSEDWDLLHEDLEQIDDLDIEEMDINWQIAMIAIRMKKFYKKTGRRVRVDGKTPVGFDKKKLECFNCHNTGHFARECTAKGTHDGKKKRDSFYQHQEAGKQEKNQMGLLTMDDGIVNWGEHTEVEETNHALMAISSSNEVSLCSKICIDSYNTLKTLCDEQMNQLGDQEAQILAYSQAVKKLEAQLVTFQKQQLSLNEKLTFQANEIYEKDEKLKRYRRIGMKAVKEKEQLQKTLDSWKDSSKNLWRLINSGMSSNDKLGLGFEIQSNDEVLSYEEEMNFSVFKCSKEDSIGKPSYSRFTKTNDFKGVPPPLSGDYTPTPQEEIDDSLYVYGKKGPQKPEISVSDDNSSEHSTCQSNDSEGSCGNTSEHSFETESESVSEPNELSKSRLEVTNEKDVSAPKSKEVEPSCVSHIKSPRQPLKDKETHKVNRKNWNDMMERELGEGYSFKKKKCFVCGSLSHLIKDCDYYEKQMAREAEVKRVVNTVQLNAGRPKLNSVRPNINTGRTNINSVKPKVNAVSSKVNVVSPKVNTVMKVAQGSLVRPRQIILGGDSRPTSVITVDPLLLETKEHPHCEEHGASEVTNSAGTPTSIASEEKDEEIELIVVPSAKRLEEIGSLKAFRDVPETTTTSTSSVNTGSQTLIRCLMMRRGVMSDFTSSLEIELGSSRVQEEHYSSKLQQDGVSWVCQIYLMECMVIVGTSWSRATKEMREENNRWDEDASETNVMRKLFDVEVTLERFSSRWPSRGSSSISRLTTLGLWTNCGPLQQLKPICSYCCCSISGHCDSKSIAYGDYGFNFMNTKIHIDNESTICIVKNPVYHSKTKHIEIRHHFIRDCYEKKLISVEKIHTDLNVADLLTKRLMDQQYNYVVLYRLDRRVLSRDAIDVLMSRRSNKSATANTIADGSLKWGEFELMQPLMYHMVSTESCEADAQKDPLGIVKGGFREARQKDLSALL